MKICIIGYGYWGKILHSNLESMSYKNITVIDKTLNNLDLINNTYDYYFISTPFSTHKEILKKISKFKNKKIWCEKPLVETIEESLEIYSMMDENNNRLFVDWVYTFNTCIFRLKEILKEKKLKQIILNRTNLGPERSDCNSIYDLSSHDLSILYYIFGEYDFEFNFNEFSIHKNKSTGSNISWCYVNGIQIILNSSWEHENKNRVSLFITVDNEIIVFDDIKKIIINNGVSENFIKEKSPIENSITYFITNEYFEENKKMTLKITKNLDLSNEYKIQ